MVNAPLEDAVLSHYLNGHLLAADAGVNAFRAAADTWRGTPHEATFHSLVAQIEEDRQALVRLVDKFGGGKHPVRNALTAVARLAGRVNPVNVLRTRRGTATQLELDTLVSAVTGKRLLWETLGHLAVLDDRLDDAQLDELIRRADSQIAQIRAVNEATAADRFTHS